MADEKPCVRPHSASRAATLSVPGRVNAGTSDGAAAAPATRSSARTALTTKCLRHHDGRERLALCAWRCRRCRTVTRRLRIDVRADAARRTSREQLLPADGLQSASRYQPPLRHPRDGAVRCRSGAQSQPDTKDPAPSPHLQATRYSTAHPSLKTQRHPAHGSPDLLNAGR
jgi:hypothetical protein